MRDAHRRTRKGGYFGAGRFEVSAGIVSKEVDRTQRWHLSFIGGRSAFWGILGNCGSNGFQTH